MSTIFSPEFIDELAEAIVSKMAERAGSAAATAAAPRLMSVKDAAAYIGRTPAALYQLINRGRIPAVREGQRVQVERADLDRWIEQNKGRA